MFHDTPFAGVVIVDGCCRFEKADDAVVLVDCLDFLFFFICEFFLLDFVADVEAPFVVVRAVGQWVFVDWLFVVGGGRFVVRISGLWIWFVC